MAAIHTEDLCLTYPNGWLREQTAALRSLNLTVQEGEIFGFLGPNGAGKTTTIHLLLNLLRPTRGTAHLFDIPVTETAVRRRLGYLPESVNLHHYYRARSLLDFYARLCEVPADTRSSRVIELLKRMRLEESAEKTVAQCSKGMAQRLGFAQAMLHDPDLLILDEPTASLDPVGRKEFRDILLDLKRRGKTVFISSHILSEVESVCDRVAILKNGELKRVGTLPELSAGQSSKLHLQNLPASVLESLIATPAEVTWFQGKVTIRCPDESVRHTVEAILRQNHVEIVRTETDAQTLEQIFFSAIEPPPQT